MDKLLPAEVDLPDHIPVLGRDIARANAYHIDPRLLICEPAENGRFAAPAQSDLDTIARSLARSGQIHPIKVRRDGPYLRVVIGFHRTMGAVHGIARGILPEDFKLRYEMEDKRLTATDEYLRKIAENAERKSLTTMDYARAVDTLVTVHGMNQTQAARAIGKTRAWASSVRRLLELKPVYQDWIHTGKMTAEAGYEILTTPDQGLAETAITAMNPPYTSVMYRAKLRELLDGGYETTLEREESPVADELGPLLLEHSSFPSLPKPPTTGKPKSKGKVAATKTGRSMKELRAFLESLPGDYPDNAERSMVMVFSRLWLRFLDGKISDRRMRTELTKGLIPD